MDSRLRGSDVFWGWLGAEPVSQARCPILIDSRRGHDHPGGAMETTPSPLAPGEILVHATCLDMDGQGVLLRGPSGSGKSDLALRLVDEGLARLVADDYTRLTPTASGTLEAACPLTTVGLLEVRGLGVVVLPSHALSPLVRVRMVVDLLPMPKGIDQEIAQEVERLPDSQKVSFSGISLPLFTLCAFEASAPARLRLMLAATLGDVSLAC